MLYRKSLHFYWFQIITYLLPCSNPPPLPSPLPPPSNSTWSQPYLAIADISYILSVYQCCLICVCIILSVYQRCLAVYLSIYLSIYPSIRVVYLFIYPSFSVFWSVYLSFYLSISVVYLSILIIHLGKILCFDGYLLASLNFLKGTYCSQSCLMDPSSTPSRH